MQSVGLLLMTLSLAIVSLLPQAGRTRMPACNQAVAAFSILLCLSNLTACARMTWSRGLFLSLWDVIVSSIRRGIAFVFPEDSPRAGLWRLWVLYCACVLGFNVCALVDTASNLQSYNALVPMTGVLAILFCILTTAALAEVRSFVQRSGPWLCCSVAVPSCWRWCECMHPLCCCYWQARNLSAADSNGASDPYVVARYGGTVAKTAIRPVTTNPIWFQTLRLSAEMLPPKIAPKVSPLLMHPSTYRALNCMCNARQ